MNNIFKSFTYQISDKIKIKYMFLSLVLVSRIKWLNMIDYLTGKRNTVLKLYWNERIMEASERKIKINNNRVMINVFHASIQQNWREVNKMLKIQKWSVQCFTLARKWQWIKTLINTVLYFSLGMIMSKVDIKQWQTI